MARKYWRGREIDTGPEGDPEYDPLGPDDRDRDLFDERWASLPAERGRASSPLVRFGIAAISIIAVLSMILPMIAAITQ